MNSSISLLCAHVQCAQVQDVKSMAAAFLGGLAQEASPHIAVGSRNPEQ
jgi:hypothetical protein